MSDYDITEEDLAENITKRLPCVLCIDTSGSMSRGTSNGLSRIDNLKNGIRLLFENIRNDETAHDSVELAIVSFSSYVQVISEFSTIDNKNLDDIIYRIEANGRTNMGEGARKSLELIKERKQQYRENRIDYWRPWLILMSDGRPTDNVTAIQEEIKNEESAKGLTIFQILIGNENGIETLNGFSNQHKAKQLSETKFEEFFEWLSNSMSSLTNSAEGESVAPQPTDDWSAVNLND